jgi:hypothetical protein
MPCSKGTTVKVPPNPSIEARSDSWARQGLLNYDHSALIRQSPVALGLDVSVRDVPTQVPPVQPMPSFLARRTYHTNVRISAYGAKKRTVAKPPEPARRLPEAK